MPEKIENGVFTLWKTSVHTTPEEFKNATITGYFGFGFLGKLDQVNYMIRDAIILKKLRFQNVFCPH